MQVRFKEESQRSRDMNSALATFVTEKSNPADWWHRQDRSPEDVNRSSDIKKDALGTDLPTRVRATVSRAARLIRTGIGADGVLFLDASDGSAGSPIDPVQGTSQNEIGTARFRTFDTSVKQVKSQPDRGAATTKTLTGLAEQSLVLGSAYSVDVEAWVKRAIEQAKTSEGILKGLLRRYPNGLVWHFNAEGDASDDDSCPIDDHTSATEGDESAGSKLDWEESTTPTTKRASRRACTRKRDSREIQSIFPGIRSLVLLGMWDPSQERWFGVSIAMSYSPVRIFSTQDELRYIAAFCDVVLAEIWQLEAQELSRSKNDFVSSLSHELRSPLHGILGSAECLEEQGHSMMSAELIRSITSCGNTLLDVVRFP